MTTLDRENTTPWNPAGRPTWMMRSITFRSMRSCLRSTRRGPISSIRHRSTRKAETYWEMAVAVATPATSMWKMITVTRLSTTLMIPRTSRKFRGRRVSPSARRMALPKLYTMVAGMPMK